VRWHTAIWPDEQPGGRHAEHDGAQN